MAELEWLDGGITAVPGIPPGGGGARGKAGGEKGPPRGYLPPPARAAREMARLAAELLRIPATHVLVASTGVIGVHLPMDRIRAALPKLVKSLSPQGGRGAAPGR